MTLKRKLGSAVMLIAILSVAWFGLTGETSANTTRSTPLASSGFDCTFQTLNGFYLTAVGGGGRTTDVIHSDATVARSWEKFNLISKGSGNIFAIQTLTGNYLTAVDGGGRTTDVIHSDATVARSWEIFALISIGSDLFGIRTINNHFLTAVGKGGRTTDVIHSDATQINSWEEFHVNCAR